MELAAFPNLVLVVDDEPVVLQLVATTLQSRGLETVTAIGPAACAGVNTTSVVSLLTSKHAVTLPVGQAGRAAPSQLTASAPARPVPVSVTCWPPAVGP